MKNENKYSILYPDFNGVEYKKLSETTCHDLSLDLILRSLTDNPKEYKLIMDTISLVTSDLRVANFRQKVFCDILRFPDLRKKMLELFDKFEFIRNFGVLNWNTDEKKGIWHLFRRLDELNDYIACVESLKECLRENEIESDGLKGFKEYVDNLYNDANFGELKKDIAALKVETTRVKSITIGINVNESFEATELGLVSINSKYFKKSGIVSNFADAINSKDKINDTTNWDKDMHFHPVDSSPNDLTTALFSKKIGGNLMGLMKLSDDKELNETMASVADGDGMANFTLYLSNVANKMLDMLSRKLKDTLNKYADVVVVNISKIIPEFVYYIRFAEFIEEKMEQGYVFCEAKATDNDSLQMNAKDFYNLKLVISGMKKEDIVVNDLDFSNEHTVYILTGANRGGKTTVTQGIGIMYVLAQGGIFVPAKEFCYKPVDLVYTHFPADEDKTFDLGRLGEECLRFKECYNICTKDSLCLLNESFSTTSFEEGYYIAKDSVKALLKKSVKTIFNTHMHKLGEAVCEFNMENSLAKASSLIVKNEEGTRSFKVEIAPPEGMSYARDIAEKYGVTYEMLTEGM